MDGYESIATQTALNEAFPALAHPVRRFLLEILENDGAGAMSLAASAADTFGISSQRGSHHLQVLARAGLVTVQHDGLHRHYTLAAPAFDPVTTWITTVVATATGASGTRRRRPLQHVPPRLAAVARPEDGGSCC
ncbi:ArsR/SmtB family transcription factor [Demequina globuliformis]|uniref:ArsR/SmtB family transcription factor n=1 Tax=Demequina globuliformis TaxID=676202 RepID=UPI0007818F45|nr:helix-turn-helix domain-containing protein [Demequina globuliformis]